MLGNLSGLEAALIGLAVLVFFIVRQFGTRPVVSRWTVIIPLVLAYLGFQGLLSLDGTGWVLLGVNLVLGVVLGLARGATFRVWVNEHGKALMRGTGLTLAFWAATVAARVGMVIVERQMGLGAAVTSNTETMLPAAATLGAQVLIVYLRSQNLPLPMAG
jgi:hypothetical protein